MRKIIGLSAAVVALSGCMPMPIEQSEPYRHLTVDMPLRDVYENIMKHPYCSFGAKPDGEYDSYEGRFFVKLITWPQQLEMGAISGQALDDGKTLLHVHNQASIQKPQVNIEPYVTRLLTGSCK